MPIFSKKCCYRNCNAKATTTLRKSNVMDSDMYNLQSVLDTTRVRDRYTRYSNASADFYVCPNHKDIINQAVDNLTKPSSE